MKRSIILIFTFLLLSNLFAQQEKWDTYLAQYEKGPGSVLINMNLIQSAPNLNFPFLVTVGVKFNECDSKGLPLSSAFEKLYKVSDSITAVISISVKNILAGTFTYQCERTDYFYTTDTTRLRNKIINLMSKQFPEYIPIVKIKQDKDWSVYLKSLYPNEETMEYMENEKVLLQLQKSGDKLEKERQVDHWIYFSSEVDRNCFIRYATENKFKIESKGKDNTLKLPYKLQLSRTDKIDLSAISKVTLELKKEAKKCNGDYDGWETFVIK